MIAPKSAAVARIPLVNGGFALVDRADAPLVEGQRWRSERGYVVWKMRASGKQRKTYMHRLILGLADGLFDVKVDHHNSDRSDNRRRNLRICTHSQNLANRGRQANGSSGYKGVTWEKRRKLWVAQVHVRGRHIHVGSFADREAAARAYDAAATFHFGEFAQTNFGRSIPTGRAS